MSVTKIIKFQVMGEGRPISITCRMNRILDIQLQGQSLVCWIETRDELPETTTEIVSVGTGWEIPSDVIMDSRYIKTVQDADGYVWHFYELLSGH